MRKGEVWDRPFDEKKIVRSRRHIRFSMARGTKEDGEGRFGGIDDSTHRP